MNYKTTITPAELGDRLSSHRISRELTQREVAETLRISPSELSRIERGYRYPSVDILQHLADIYGVSVDSLLTPYQP